MNAYDLQTGYQIISRLPLANAPLAQIEINRFLDSLLQTPPSAEVYLQLLEQTRIALSFIDEELAEGYINKALPLGTIEEDRFQQTVATWRKVARAYAHCARVQGGSGQAPNADGLVMILHRCIFATEMVIYAHFRVRRELPAGVWLDLHGYYASAEEWGVATVVVPGIADSAGRQSSCADAYVGILLLELVEPYGLTLREMALIWQWSSLWSSLTTMEPIEPDAPVPMLALDLMQDSAVGSVSERSALENLRKLGTSQLLELIRQIRRQLSQKISPSELGLGSDCTAGQCQRLLKRAFKSWSLLRGARNFPRHKTTGKQSKVCTGLPAIHYFISGKEFVQPAAANMYSRQDFESLFAFRHLTDTTQQLEFRQSQLGFTQETWQMIDESAAGLRLLRSARARRFEIGQLLSICPADATTYFLAQVVWLMQERSGSLQVGVAVFPGKPQAVAVRPVAQQSVASSPHEYERAFVLPEIPSLGVEQTLILPAGWYHPQRHLDLYTDRVWRVCLGRLVTEGLDFTRVIFTAL